GDAHVRQVPRRGTPGLPGDQGHARQVPAGRAVELLDARPRRRQRGPREAAMKILTVLGTRPEIIRLSRVIARLDELCEHVLVHTGQNYDASLKEVFFRELGVRQPDVTLNARGGVGAQLGTILAETEALLTREKPDRLLILGDTNSGLSAV